MSTTSALDNNEDLENVPLVRMEDVQPQDRHSDIYLSGSEVLETCIVENIIYDGECLVNGDDDSNIGSMVSIQSVQSEEVVCADSDSELIIPDIVDTPGEQDLLTTTQAKANPPDSWPTLEILPGGVIKHADKLTFDEDEVTYCTDNNQGTSTDNEMTYACAKCSQSFKYLFCLVKHVRWHEDEKKKEKAPDISLLSETERQMIEIRQVRLEFEKSYKQQKLKIMTRIGDALSKMDNIKHIFN